MRPPSPKKYGGSLYLAVEWGKTSAKYLRDRRGYSEIRAAKEIKALADLGYIAWHGSYSPPSKIWYLTELGRAEAARRHEVMMRIAEPLAQGLLLLRSTPILPQLFKRAFNPGSSDVFTADLDCTILEMNEPKFKRLLNGEFVDGTD